MLRTPPGRRRRRVSVCLSVCLSVFFLLLVSRDACERIDPVCLKPKKSSNVSTRSTPYMKTR
ncbi:hypothetical protein CSUI_006013 [Cystoisospora suis]|uniref:Transmembrane protein n=1 Tax=Cystoisospora suis TaxID=483139 RepID=A0A2C6KVJ9_9APIC|nr:hypothetical protein CSUI_006013 [Cystoisospora suis]